MGINSPINLKVSLRIPVGICFVRPPSTHSPTIFDAVRDSWGGSSGHRSRTIKFSRRSASRPSASNSPCTWRGRLLTEEDQLCMLGRGWQKKRQHKKTMVHLFFLGSLFRFGESESNEDILIPTMQPPTGTLCEMCTTAPTLPTN